MFDRRNCAGISRSDLLDEIAHPFAIFALNDATPLRPIIAQLTIPFVIEKRLIAFLQILFRAFGLEHFAEHICVIR